jgi:hypothetical protein
MSLLNSNSFVPYNNIKLKLYNETNINNYPENQNETNRKDYTNKEFNYLYDKCFLQKQNTVLDIIEELRCFDSRNGTDLFKNILYLNLYNLLYN